MTSANPIDLLFGGMDKLGPGSDAETLRVLGMLPVKSFNGVVDAGCGAGRQTLALARELDVAIDAVDSYRPFLDLLERRSAEAGLERRVRTHCMDMSGIPAKFDRVDLLWSEGALYNIGFAHALKHLRPCLSANGFLVASELCWLNEWTPAKVRDFFRGGYPDMKNVDENVALAENAGYRLLATHVLPRSAWTEAYYDVLKPRAEMLANHKEKAVRDFACDTLTEIDAFMTDNDSYGYVFFLLQKN